MMTLSPDTSPEAERVQIEILRRMPAWRKLQMAGQLHEACRLLIMSDLRHRYPGEPPEKLRWRLAERLLGWEMTTKAYGRLPE